MIRPRPRAPRRRPDQTTAVAPVGAAGPPLGGPVGEPAPPEAHGPVAPGWEPPPVTPRSLVLAGATVTTSLLVAVAALLPAPYAVSSPGPTRDTLGESRGEPLVTVDGVPTYESTGELLLTTVAVAGGPGFPVGLPMLLRGWVDDSRAVRPVEEVFAPTETEEQIDERNQAAMVSSQENATVAALEQLGYEVPTELVVVDPVEGTGAEGVVEPEDVIVALEGTDLTSFAQLTEQLEQVEPGSSVVLTVLRGGERVDLDLVTGDSGEGRALLGVYIDPTFELPFEVSIQIENIGGPSAGMMFALGIIDTLTPEDETGGETIAGTGTVDLSGDVGPIGGIRQKLHGAVRDGASWFLAPEDNCDEVVGSVPDGLRVVRVATLDDARAAVEAIGAGTAQDLPTCER
ncbi:PDZ domain-containing protein [Actinotalea sp. Marseille-Q4924]|uniref:YlbL family protein n=1 Tax=Actinotalea sp. Marseille-Q4924 TaxID=2866571 RepID=UPI001CE3EAA4|nr:S16 family serine protease [Actinotalea sp. Marseille-Q4924]